jgi:glutaredoxin 3
LTKRWARSTSEGEMAKVEIYTKAFCGYCVRAKHLLDSKGADYEEFDLTFGGAKRAEMVQRANGRNTVPQIFIDGRHIGGSDDLVALECAGELDALLAT